MLNQRDFAVCIHSVDLDKNAGHNSDLPSRYIRLRGRLMEAFAIMRQVPNLLIYTLVNVYVDLVVFTRIAGTLKTGSGRYWR